MKAFIGSRNMISLVFIIFGAVALIFSPWGSVPAPYLDLGLSAPLVPLRAIALVAVGYLPLLSLSHDTRVHDVSSPRSMWLLQAAAPSALTAIAAAAAAVGATVTAVDALGSVRNLLLGTALSSALYRVMGPLAFVLPVLGALLCAALREERAWWAVTNQPGTFASLLLALALAAVALQLAAVRPNLTTYGP